MQTKSIFLTIVTTVAVSGCATTGDGSSWQCSAEGLINAHYTGSDRAMIHLQGFSSGGSYKVSKNADGTEATGTTANGTPFKCVRLQ